MPTITRTINVYTPDGKVTTIKQVAHLHRSVTTDKVTGQSTYGPWSEDPTDWQEYVPANIPGYTVSPADVPAVVVKDGQQDVTVNIHYYAQANPDQPNHGHINGGGEAFIVPGSGNVSGQSSATQSPASLNETNTKTNGQVTTDRVNPERLDERLWYLECCFCRITIVAT